MNISKCRIVRPNLSDPMDSEIATLLEEAANAKAWFVKLSSDLKADPTNERLLRLQELCRLEFDKRWDKLSDLGMLWSASTGAIARPRIEL